MSHRTVLATLLVSSAWLASPAMAQDDRESAQTPASEIPAREIVVTALKREEKLATVAAPVSVVSGDRIRRAAVTTADRLAEQTASLTIFANPTANIVFLRGIGNFTLLPSTDPAIGWNYDGVFVGRANGSQGQFYDLDRVEVLKGPQGVLYGRNASGGTINLIPHQPEAGASTGRVTASYATHDTLSFDGFANVALGDTGALRVSGQLLSQDSLLTGFAGSRQGSARVQLKSELTPALTVRMAADFTALRGVGQGTTYLGYYLYDGAAAAYKFVPSNLSLGQGNRSPEGQAFRQTVPLVALGRNLDAQAAVPYQNNELYGGHAEIEADLGFATLNVLPAWRYGDFDQIPSGAPFGYDFVESSDQRSVEARLSSNPGRLSWLLGGLLFDEDVRSQYQNNFSTQLNVSDSRYGTRSRAAFANATFAVIPGVRLVGGVRRSWDTKSLAAVTASYTLRCNTVVAGKAACPNVPLLQLGSSPAAAGLPVPGPGQTLPILVGGVSTGAVISRVDRIDTARSARFAVTTWRGGLEADLGTAGVAYATVQKGYRPGGLNTATGYETYAPERVIAYTLGARWRDVANRLSLTGEAFWWDYRDQQVSSVQPDLSTPARNVNFTRNIGRSRIRGVEVEANLHPAERTRLFANAQYLDARYSDFTFLQLSQNVPPLTGCATALTATASVYKVDCSGQRPFASPKWTVNTGVWQEVPVGAAKLDIMAKARFVSAQNGGAAFLASQIVPSHWTLDAQAILALPGDRVELSLFAYNIADKRYPALVLFHPTTNLVVSSVSPPRIVGVRSSIRF